MLTKIYSATTVGIRAHPIAVEVDLSYGMLQFHIVGLPDAAIRESRQRIMTALKQCGFRLPERKITVNLAPANLKKEGTCFDVPIALGILAAAGLVPISVQWAAETLIMGELSLDGAIMPVRGVLSVAAEMRLLEKRRIIVAPDNGREAAMIPDIEVYAMGHMRDLVAWLREEMVCAPLSPYTLALPDGPSAGHGDLGEVRGQRAAKRALQIAAAGWHNIVLVGSPGSGKTMLARRVLSLMPPMTFSELLATSRLYSASGKLPDAQLLVHRPFRAPHHSISLAGLVGGGSMPQPGEISFAHNGVLFLDELLEFQRATLEVLRQPLEEGVVHISRVQYSVEYPARFLLVAALNPCPCGFLDDPRRPCSCNVVQVKRYLDRLSGPLLDRIDLQVLVSSMQYDEVHAVRADQELSSAELWKGVVRARMVQAERWGDTGMNATMSAADVVRYCVLDPATESLVRLAFEKLRVTMRGYHKLLKVARTIADMAGSDTIGPSHFQEAMMYRSIDRMRER